MLSLNPIFSSHMVFAANKPIRIYGEGCGSAEIHFAEYHCKVVSEGGVWQIQFPPLPYGGPYTLTLIQQNDTYELNDIYIGEVYLLGGQSNMEFKLSESSTLPEKWHSNNMLRLFSPNRIAGGDGYSPEDGWICAKKEEVGDWSAIGYLTGDLICQKKGIAVGLISCYQGASVIESWVPAGTFENAGILLEDKDKFCDHFEATYAAWNGDGILYDFLLSQIQPFSISTVLWYQGESDCSVAEANVYAKELCQLIDVWRTGFEDPELSFLIIQLADNLEPARKGWKLIQKAQLEVPLLRSNVQTVICADICEDYEIHPRTKEKLAERMADIL